MAQKLKAKPVPQDRVIFHPVLYSNRTAGQLYNEMKPYEKTLPFTVTRLHAAIVQFDCQDEATAETIKEAIGNILGAPFTVSFSLF